MQLKTNSLLQSGKYRIIRLLGQGGFGITYLAENTMLGKQVAIKEFFPKDFCGRDNTSHLTLGTQNNADTVSKLKARFIKEAQNIAKLDHPGIVHIHDIFEENNTAYYVMDYIDGENLTEIVKCNGPLPEGKTVKYVEKVGEALEYIHSRNMTHFDVKPANIVIRKKDDQPILIDFGLSKQYDAHGDATSTLMQGISQGYSPIELYNYGSVSTFSPQTDVYSLGATLLYLVSGKVPPQPSSIIENGLDLSFVGDSKLRKAIESSMQVGRGKRPESMRKFLNSLTDIEQNKEKAYASQSSEQDRNDDSTRIIPEPVSDSASYSYSSKSKTSEKWLRRIIIIIIIICIGAFMTRSCGETNHAGDTDSIVEGIENGYYDSIENLPILMQVKNSIPKSIDEPNFYSNSSTSNVIPPKIKLISQKYVDPGSDESDKVNWLDRNGLSNYDNIIFDNVPWLVNIDASEFPIPYNIGNSWIYSWSKDQNFNYFIYGPEDWEKPHPSRLIITNKDNSKLVEDLTFDKYLYSPEFEEEDKMFVDEQIHEAIIQNNILYFSHYHETYAESSCGLNGYITALNLSTKKVEWTTNPLVCNCNFVIYKHVIITGYGFTDEPDYLSIIDITNGQTIKKIPLANGPRHIIIANGKIYVLTYSYEYIFSID